MAYMYASFAYMDEGLEGSPIFFGPGDRNGMLHGIFLCFSFSISLLSKGKWIDHYVLFRFYNDQKEHLA
jgi:hypothetical protein